MSSHSAELPVGVNNKAGEMYDLITFTLVLISPLSPVV